MVRDTIMVLKMIMITKVFQESNILLLNIVFFNNLISFELQIEIKWFTVYKTNFPCDVIFFSMTFS